MQIKTTLFDQFANWITQLAGSSGAFLTACLAVIIWVLAGPLFGCSQDWQLFIKTPEQLL